MRLTLCLAVIASLTVIFACRFSPDNTLTLQVKYDERGSRMPSSADQFNCYVVSVAGSKLSSGLDSELASCLGLGKMSDVVSLETLREKGISLSVPAGEPIKVRLLGIEKGLSESCSDLKLTSLLTAAGTEVYELGSEATTAYADSEIEIKNNYTANSSALIAQCQSDTTDPDPQSGELTLAHVYEGAAEGSVEPMFNESLSVLPPPDFNSAPLDDLTGSTDVLGASALSFFTTSPSKFKRMDFLFSFNRKIFPASLLGFRVKIAAEGGWISASVNCDGANVNQGNGYRLEVVRNGDWHHTEAITTTSFTQVEEQTIDLSPASDYVTTETRGEFFHLSVRSMNFTQSGSPIKCSALKITSLTVTEIHSREGQP